MEEKSKSVEEILKELVRKKGTGYLREGKYFVNAVQELGGGEEDVILLRYLVETGGHLDLLNAGSLSPAMQRSRYVQTVDKLCAKRLISEELAHRICAVFWRAVYHTAPPAEWMPPVPKETPQELFNRGWGCDQQQNMEEAVKWYRLAAEQGHIGAQDKLAWCLFNGKGIPENKAEAVSWYRRAAEQGDAHAQSNLGVCLLYGNGVPCNEAEAVEWFRRSALQGDAGAQRMLGICLMDGKGVPANQAEALHWFRRSAEGGNVEANNHIGWSYQSGSGVAVDYGQAAYWYRKGADLGDSFARNNLSVLYENGWGVPKDMNLAVYWCRLAAQQGHESAKERLPRLEQMIQTALKPEPPKPASPKQESRKDYIYSKFYISRKEAARGGPIRVYTKNGGYEVHELPAGLKGKTAVFPIAREVMVGEDLCKQDHMRWNSDGSLTAYVQWGYLWDMISGWLAGAFMFYITLLMTQIGIYGLDWVIEKLFHYDLFKGLSVSDFFLYIPPFNLRYDNTYHTILSVVCLLVMLYNIWLGIDVSKEDMKRRGLAIRELERRSKL